MAIAIGHSQDPSAAPRLAYGAGIQQGIASRQSEERRYAYSAQEAARQRQQQLQAMQLNAQLQEEAAQQAQERKIEMMDQSWQMKDDHEKQQIQDKRAQYLRKRQLVDEEKRKGTINEQQYDYAMKELQARYADGDVDVTDPFFSDIAKKDQENKMEMPDGTMIDMAIDPRTGQPDRYKTKMDWEKAQFEKKETILKAKMELAKSKMKMMIDLRKEKIGTGSGDNFKEESRYTKEEINEIVRDTFAKEEEYIAQMEFGQPEAINEVAQEAMPGIAPEDLGAALEGEALPMQHVPAPQAKKIFAAEVPKLLKKISEAKKAKNLSEYMTAVEELRKLQAINPEAFSGN